MLTELSLCCKRLRLGKSLVENAQLIEADTHLEFLLKLLQAEVDHREKVRIEKLIASAGFTT